MKSILTILLMLLHLATLAQLDATKEEIVNRKGIPDENGHTEQGVPFILYWEAQTDAECGKFDHTTVYYFDKGNICTSILTMEPVCMTDSWITYLDKKCKRIAEFKWRDFESGIEMSISKKDKLMLITTCRFLKQPGTAENTQADEGKPNVVKMVKTESGTYEVPVEINNVLKISLIWDTGASDVSISPDVALTLFRTKTVSDSDFIGTSTYRFADGSTCESDVFLIHELKIGNKTLTNVKASISNSLKAPMLLGQSALQQLGKFTMDNAEHTLTLE